MRRSKDKGHEEGQTTSESHSWAFQKDEAHVAKVIERPGMDAQSDASKEKRKGCSSPGTRHLGRLCLERQVWCRQEILWFENQIGGWVGKP